MDGTQPKKFEKLNEECPICGETITSFVDLRIDQKTFDLEKYVKEGYLKRV